MKPPNDKFKILIYGEYFFPIIGGVQTSINLLAKGLTGMNARPEMEASISRIEVTVVTRTPANGMDDSTLPYRVVRRPGFRQLVKLIRESDILHIAGPCLFPMLIGWLMGKPVVVEHHGYQAICPNGLLFQLPSERVCPGYFIQRKYSECFRCCSVTEGRLGSIRLVLLTFPRYWINKRASANLTITNHVAARLKMPRMQTVYYGIEEPAPSSIQRNRSPFKRIEIAYVGRLVPEKGLRVLVQAAEILKKSGVNFRLSFIGGGPERERLEELADRLSILDFVTFTGDLRGESLDRAVSEISIVVMPSVWEETAGLSAIEQMMRGRVVIAADIGGLSEVVGDAGLKFPPGDSQALATCIRKIIDDPAMAAALGAAARVRAVQFFANEGMIRKHLSLYREVAYL